MEIQWVLLPQDEYDREYSKAFKSPEFTDNFTSESLEAEFRLFDASLRQELVKYWKEGDCGDGDFAVSDEFQDAFHHCGGIYHSRAFCPEYIQTVMGVMAGLPNSARWVYHTTVECMDEDDEEIPFCEFFIRNGKVYGSEEEFV